MRYLILSDMHANLQALEAVLADAVGVGYDQILVLGDLVGYGADPAAVIDRTLALEPAALIRGNHDKVCAGLEPASLFNDTARRSIEWTAATLSPAHLRALAALPQGPQLVSGELEICHGSPFDEDYYIFESADAWRAIEASAAPICLFGHTHMPAIFSTPEEAVPATAAQGDNADDVLVIPSRGNTLINVGSVGQPRDGDSRAAYGVLDLEERVIRFRRVVYDVAAAQARILAEGLPMWLAARLERGQ